jgi:hypothetical protein
MFFLAQVTVLEVIRVYAGVRVFVNQGVGNDVETDILDCGMDRCFGKGT